MRYVVACWEACRLAGVRCGLSCPLGEGGGVDDRSRVLLSACLGAIVGGLAGYLYLTDDGRRLRDRLEPGLDDMRRELRRLRGAVDSARSAAREGWAAVEDLRHETSDRPDRWAGPVRPPTPF